MADFYINSDYYQEKRNYSMRPTGVQYTQVTDIDTEPVTLDFFKQHARIDFDTDDTLCLVYIRAARRYLEEYTQKSFGVRTMRLSAIYTPKNYRLMYGPVDTITTTDYTNTGDLLNEELKDASIEYTTIGVNDETIQIAICRYAAGLYVFRENIIETKFAATQEMDAAKELLKSYRNISWP